MTTRFLLILFAVTTFAACQQAGEESQMSQDEQLELIKKTEDDLFTNKDKFDFTTALQLVKRYEQFATAFPEHEKTAGILFKAGDLASGMNKPQEAYRFFEKVYTNYNAHEKASDALFLMAFVSEDKIKDLRRAEKLYKEFIQKYPQHSLVSSAEFALQHLGTPTEKLVEEFEARNAASQVQ